MARTSSANTKINIYFSDPVLEALKKMAAARGTTYSELIREACRAYVIKEAPRILEETAAIRKVGK